MDVLFSILIILASAVVIFLVIIQKSRGGGLSTELTGGAALANQMGVRKATDFVEKATWWVMGVIAVLAFFANVLSTPANRKGQAGESVVTKLSYDGAAGASAPAPAMQLGDEELNLEEEAPAEQAPAAE
jgi:preprotein translocase subunit SecG